MSNEDNTLVWAAGTPDEQTFAPSDLPAVSLYALVQRGINHVSKNEIASRLVAWRKTPEGTNADDSAIAKFVSDKRAELLDKILNGKLGVRAPGKPRVSGLEAIMRKVAVENLAKRFEKYNAAHGTEIKLPTGDKVVNMSGKDMTREDFIAAELRRNGDKIKEEAQRRMASDDESLEDLI